MAFVIEGIGTAVPEASARQADIAERAVGYASADDQEARTVRALYRRSGIEQRGSVLIEPNAEGAAIPFYETGESGRDWPGTAARMQAFAAHSEALALRAARRALEDADVSPSRITRLVVVTCTGFTAPGLDLRLIPALGLAPFTKRAQVGFMGCHGALNGLEVARGLASTAGEGEHVLVVAVEICSVHAQAGMHSDDVVANAIFADGAAALVGRHGEPAPGDWVLADTRSLRVPNSESAMTWNIGDHGFRMSLSAEVPGLLDRHLAEGVDTWLGASGLRRDDVASWAVHPGGNRILDAAERALALPRDALEVSRRTLRDHGNMSSPTILFVFDALRRAGASAPCVLLAFGPGLTVEMARLDQIGISPSSSAG